MQHNIRPLRSPFSPASPHRWILAVGLIGAGVYMLLDNLGVPIEQITRYWPVMLIVLGLIMLIDRTIGLVQPSRDGRQRD